MGNKDDILSLLQKGYEYFNTYHNVPKAFEYFILARRSVENAYGKDSKLCCFVNLFDFVWEEYHGDYRAAALKLADVGALLESFGEQDVVDELTAIIFENRKELLDGVAADTFQVLTHIDFDFSPGDVLWQALLCGDDKEELINTTFIDKLGLPHKFHYLIQHMCNNGADVSLEMKSDVIEMIKFMQNIEKKDLDSVSMEEKLTHAKRMYNLIQKNYSLLGSQFGNGMSIFLEKKKETMDNIFLKGMVKFEEEDFAEELLVRMKKKDFQDIDSQLEIKRAECWLEYGRGNRAKAENILEEMKQIIEKVLMQVFSINDEWKKIEFLKGMELILVQTAMICYELYGAKAAYDMIVRTRTLSFDRKGVMSNSFVYKEFMQNVQKLDEREKRGEDVSFERAEFQKYFDRESNGIFSLDSVQICRKLSEKQAVIEFTIMRDISEYDYYFAFVVTAHGVSAVKLGECVEIDKLIVGMLKYISEYSVSKHSRCQIRMLPEYYNIYQKVLQPIGEILPQSAKKLFIAGAGKFLEIPFGMLPCFHWYDEFIEDKYCLCYLNSGKELLHERKSRKRCGAVVIGSPDFAGTLPALPSSLRETETIANILHVSPFTGKEAVAECLKKQAGLFHISTHSFKDEELEDNKDPMHQSGLVFAEGERMTAKEIAQLDLSQTDLVVLSVCGIREENGIYSDVGAGIRRAFINAGTRYLILNLWETDDNATEILMKCFYYYYINDNMSVDESLRKAKQYLKTSTVSEIREGMCYDVGMENVFTFLSEREIPYAHPYYWAGFIVIGT